MLSGVNSVADAVEQVIDVLGVSAQTPHIHPIEQVTVTVGYLGR